MGGTECPLLIHVTGTKAPFKEKSVVWISAAHMQFYESQISLIAPETAASLIGHDVERSFAGSIFCNVDGLLASVPDTTDAQEASHRTLTVVADVSIPLRYACLRRQPMGN